MSSKNVALVCVGLAVVVNAVAASPFRICDFGAATNAEPNVNALAIQKAIDAAAKVPGGGRVLVPPGEWTSGTLWLKGGVDMENVVFRRCRFENCRESYHIWSAGKKQTFGIRNVVFEDVAFPIGIPSCCGAAPGSPRPVNMHLSDGRKDGR